MKTTRILFAVMMLAIVSPTLACVDTLWTRGFGTPSHDICTGIADAGDGSYMLCGYLTDQSTLHYRATLIRLTPDGDTLGIRQFGGYEYNDFFHDVRRTSDGGYICAGITASYSYTPPGQDYWLLKTNADGDSVWSHNFGGPIGDQAKIAMEVNGGYMIAGRSNSFTGANLDIFVVKTDTNGDSLWARTFGGEDSLEDNCNAIIQAPNGDIILGGNSFRGDNQFRDMWLIRINSIGDTVWTRRFTQFGGGCSAEAIIPYEDGYLIAGYGQGHGNNDSDGLLVKINQDGDVEWSEFYGVAGSYENLYDVRFSQDGGLILFGTKEGEQSSYDYFMVKANPDGGFAWEQIYGGNEPETQLGCAVLPDNRYLIGGSTQSFTQGLSDWWLVMTEPDTCNMPPYGFRRLYPADGDSLPTPDSLQITLRWSSASDLNGDNIQYVFDIDGLVTDEADTTTSDTFRTVHLIIPLSTYVPFDWSVQATDGQDTADAQNGEGTFYVDIILNSDNNPILADNFSLSAFPNPFNSTVSISYSLPRASIVQLSIFDITGRQTAILNPGSQSAGVHNLSFTASDLPSGVYFLQAEFGNEIRTMKLLLLK